MNKKQTLKMRFSPYVRGWSGGEALYYHFALRDGGTYISSLDGVFNSAKMQVATKFLTDGKKCKFSDTGNFQFKGDEKDVEFFKLAGMLPARK